MMIDPTPDPAPDRRGPTVPTTDRPDYVADLLRRFQSGASLPPTGPAVSSEDSVSYQAHREAERLDDPAILAEIAGLVATVQRPRTQGDLAFILGCLVQNTRSAAAIALFVQLAAKTPPKPLSIHWMIGAATRAAIRECRPFVLDHLATTDGLVLGDVIQYLGTVGTVEDVPTLGALLDADCRGLGCGRHCVWALEQIGLPAALPFLERAADRHLKARKKEDKDTRFYARKAIARLTAHPSES